MFPYFLHMPRVDPCINSYWGMSTSLCEGDLLFATPTSKHALAHPALEILASYICTRLSV